MKKEHGQRKYHVEKHLFTNVRQISKLSMSRVQTTFLYLWKVKFRQYSQASVIFCTLLLPPYVKERWRSLFYIKPVVCRKCAQTDRSQIQLWWDLSVSNLMGSYFYNRDLLGDKVMENLNQVLFERSHFPWNSSPLVFPSCLSIVFSCELCFPRFTFTRAFVSHY